MDIEEMKDNKDEKIEISKEELDKIIAEAIRAQMEAEQRRAEQEKKREEYILKIKGYFPGAKEEKLNLLNYEKLQLISEKLDNIAASLGYTPAPVRREKITTFTQAIKQNFIIVLILTGVLGTAITAFLVW